MSHAGATLLLHSSAAERIAQGTALGRADILALPAGPAREALGGWITPLLAASAYTASIGLLLTGLAVLGARLLGRRSATLRWGLGVAVLLLMATAAWVDQAPWRWLWLAAIFCPPYSLRLYSGPAVPPPRRSVSAAISTALLLVPLLLVINADTFRDLRTGLLALPGGTTVVNGYYRYGLLAADPIKAPAQRLAWTYTVASGDGLGRLDTVAVGQIRAAERPASATKLPPWLQCRREPSVLLPVPASASPLLTFRTDKAGGIAVRAPGYAVALDRGNASDRLADAAATRDTPWFRRLAALGVVVGMPVVLAAGVVVGLQRRLGQRPPWLIGAAACTGLGLAFALSLLPTTDVVPDPKGTAVERLYAASAEGTSLAALDDLMTHEPVLPVRARALAQRIRRAADPAEFASEVGAAATWYEQWYGYRALLDRGWHPLESCN